MSRKMAYRPFFDPSPRNVILGFSSKSSPIIPIRSKFGGSGQKNVHKKFGKIISVRFIDINLVKNAIYGGQFGKKYVIFGKNGQNWVILAQNDSIGQNYGKVGKKFSSKNLEKIFQSGLWT